MIGTLFNTCMILVGSIVGSLLKKGLKEKQQRVLFDAMGLAAAGIGINAIVNNMPDSQYPVLFSDRDFRPQSCCSASAPSLF